MSVLSLRVPKARPLVHKAGRVGRWCTTSTVPLLVLPAALGAEVYAFGSALEPDSTYFTSGVALFPSPVGTVIGTVGGYRGLALANAVAAAAIILLVALIARELGNRPLVAQGIALLLAPAGWTKEWGMDSPALAILLGATLLYLKGRSPLALAGVFLAAATHLAALPLAVSAIVACSPRRRGLLIGGVLVCAGASLALVTPYRAGFNILSEPQALAEGARELFDACWPLLLLLPIATIVPRGRPVVLGAAIGAIVAGAIPATVNQVGVTRYAVPCFYVAAGTLRLRRPLAVLHRSTRSG